MPVWKAELLLDRAIARGEGLDSDGYEAVREALLGALRAEAELMFA